MLPFLSTPQKILTGTTLLTLLAHASPVAAQTRDWSLINSKCYVNTNDVGGAQRTVSQVATLQGLECVFVNILSIAISAIGLGAFIMLLVGAFQYLTSQGAPKEMEGAKKTISFAVFGLVLAISSWIILNFVGVFTGTSSWLNVFRVTLP